MSMPKATQIPPHANPAVETFLVKLRSLARSDSNPDGIVAETLAMNMGTKTSTLRKWLYGEAVPRAAALETHQRKLDLISGVPAKKPALPAGPPPEKVAVAPGFTVRPLPIPKKGKA